METSDKEIEMTHVATFQNHYGALLLKKAMGKNCSVRAVPRALSSSCGTCAFVEDSSLEEILKNANMDLLEGVFEKEGEKYSKVYG